MFGVIVKKAALTLGGSGSLKSVYFLLFVAPTIVGAIPIAFIAFLSLVRCPTQYRPIVRCDWIDS